MSSIITTLSFNPATESATDADVVLAVFDGDIVSSGNFTNYENGITQCPNGKFMKLESFSISDECFANIHDACYGNSGVGDSYTLSELKATGGADPFDSATLIDDGTYITPTFEEQVLNSEHYYVIETQVVSWNTITFVVNGQHPEITMELYDSTKILVHTFTTTSGSYYESSASTVPRGNLELVMPYYVKIKYLEDSIYSGWSFYIG